MLNFMTFGSQMRVLDWGGGGGSSQIKYVVKLPHIN